MAASGEGGGGVLDWEFGVSRYKLLYIEWINSKVLLCSIGNHIQYPVIKQCFLGEVSTFSLIIVEMMMFLISLMLVPD